MIQWSHVPSYSEVLCFCIQPDKTMEQTSPRQYSSVAMFWHQQSNKSSLNSPIYCLPPHVTAAPNSPATNSPPLCLPFVHHPSPPVLPLFWAGALLTLWWSTRSLSTLLSYQQRSGAPRSPIALLILRQPPRSSTALLAHQRLSKRPPHSPMAHLTRGLSVLTGAFWIILPIAQVEAHVEYQSSLSELHCSCFLLCHC